MCDLTSPEAKTSLLKGSWGQLSVGFSLSSVYFNTPTMPLCTFLKPIFSTATVPHNGKHSSVNHANLPLSQCEKKKKIFFTVLSFSDGLQEGNFSSVLIRVPSTLEDPVYLFSKANLSSIMRPSVQAFACFAKA